MELKTYQQDVLDDLTQYIRTLNHNDNISSTFASYWKSRGADANDDIHYHDNVKGVPNVTIKVPTAGGKTFIACNALRTIFDELPERPLGQVVVWFVPSDTILTQTLHNLKDQSHPYRQKLDALFNNCVCVVDKSEALSGNGISPTDIASQLTIFVLSVQSFIERTQKNHIGKSYLNDPLAYRDNGNLDEYVKQLDSYYNSEINIEAAEESSLIRYIAMLNPVTIIDESHNFTSDLRVETLKNIHPSFIFDLTATPREESNIISYVDASKLKKENMVKLPVIVYNNRNKMDAISTAIILRRQLETKAKLMQQVNGKYVRPIVLFQAEPRTSDDTQTYEKIKKVLLEGGIPEKEVKIKTANANELKGVDLMSPTCPVRYIITVNALKEGWDCPFAYILATIANRTSKIDVEQIIGRILRQPYTTRFDDEMLNMSYILTCGENFNETVEEVVKGLNHSGYSRKDYRKVEHLDIQQQTPEQTATTQPDLFENQTQHNEEVEDITDDLDSSQIKDAITASLDEQASVNEISQMAQQQGEDYRHQVEQESNGDNNNLPPTMNSRPKYFIRDNYKEVADSIVLPNFCVPVVDNALFSVAASEIQAPLTRKYLLKGFNLSKQNKEISFDLNLEARAVDLESRGKDESSVVAINLNKSQQQAILAVMSAGSRDTKLSTVTQSVCKMLRKDNEIGSKDMHDYVKSVLDGESDSDLMRMANMLPTVADRFKTKITKLKNEYAEKRFQDLTDNGTLHVCPEYHFPESIACSLQAIYPNGLYEEEDGNMDKFEKQVIDKVSNLNNILFWHRNPVGPLGFKISGYVYNHYTDFIVVTKKQNIILIETKGRQLDGSDSKYKIEIGRKWDYLAGQQYHYFMVFPDDAKDPLPNAMSESRLMQLLQNM